MRFTDGFWLMRPGVEAHYARQAYALDEQDGALVVTAPTKVVEALGDTLNLPVLTVTVAPHLPGIVRVRIDHHTGGGEPLRFATAPASGGSVRVASDREPWHSCSIREEAGVMTTFEYPFAAASPIGGLRLQTIERSQTCIR